MRQNKAISGIESRLEENAVKFGDPDCGICNGLGHVFDPGWERRGSGAFTLCECLRKKAKADAPPYLYYNSQTNVMEPCPTRGVRLAVERMNLLQQRSGIPARYLWKFISSIDIQDSNHPTGLNTSLVIALDHSVETIHDFGSGTRQGLYLRGPAGSGKTLISCAILNELIRLYQTPVKYAKISRDVLSKLRASFNPNSEFYGEGHRIEEELARVEALVIDDFGVHRESEWVNTVLYDLIDARYENNLLTIITSNDPLDSIRDVFQGRLYSRIREMCVEIGIDAPDYRMHHSRQYLT
jgi:DNA replication protein DnaC